MNRDQILKLREHYDNPANDLSEHIEQGTPVNDVDPDPFITTSVRLPKSLLDWVRDQAEVEHVKPTALMRRWIEERREGQAGTAERLRRLEDAVFRS